MVRLAFEFRWLRGETLLRAAGRCREKLHGFSGLANSAVHNRTPAADFHPAFTIMGKG
jgi:hypothetical protein